MGRVDSSCLDTWHFNFMWGRGGWGRARKREWERKKERKGEAGPQVHSTEGSSDVGYNSLLTQKQAYESIHLLWYSTVNTLTDVRGTHSHHSVSNTSRNWYCIASRHVNWADVWVYVCGGYGLLFYLMYSTWVCVCVVKYCVCVRAQMYPCQGTEIEQMFECMCVGVMDYFFLSCTVHEYIHLRLCMW